MNGIEVRPLNSVSARQLQAVFSEETREWDRQLLWDYRPILGIISNFIRSGSLPGFVIRSGQSEPIGYSYFVVDRPAAFIGDVYIRRQFATRQNYLALIDSTIQSLIERRQIKRIESQVFPLNCEFEAIFSSYGFRTIQRYFLVTGTDTSALTQPSRPIGGFTITNWEPHLARGCADAIYDSYIDSPDRELCRDYQTPIGCLRFLKNLVENPACGQFSGADTLVALDGDRRVCGILLATTIRMDTGMIPQISVRRDCQDRGLGTSLLLSYMDQARRQGLTQVALSVSAPNEGAFRLYRRLGFEVRKEFYAFVWERRRDANP